MASEFRSSKKRKVCSKPSLNAREPKSINELPHEILLKIFSHIGPEDLALNISKVCRRWKNVAEDVWLWKSLSYNCDKSSDIRRVKEVLTAAHKLQSLIVRERKDAAHILEILFHKPCDLRKLTLDHCSLGEDSAGLLTKFVDIYPDLQVLSLDDCEQLTPAFYGLIPRLKKLSELKLSDWKVLCGTTLHLIADSCQDLKKLSLSCGIQISDDDIVHVIKKLGKKLRILELDGHFHTDVVYLSLNNCARCIHLKHLEVALCRYLTDAGISIVTNHCSQLRTMDLCGLKSITGEGWLPLVASNLPHLRRLSLKGCLSVRDEYVEELVANVPKLKIIKWEQ